MLQAFGANLIELSSEKSLRRISDPLAKLGVPAFGLLQDGRVYFKYHHTAADTLDNGALSPPGTARECHRDGCDGICPGGNARAVAQVEKFISLDDRHYGCVVKTAPSLKCLKNPLGQLTHLQFKRHIIFV